jgi:AraC-like DNA-binding protein/quercetin dioxygenase-like cupin family protein
MCAKIYKKGGDFMESLKFGEVEIKYNETSIESSVLWEKHCHSRFELIAVLEGDVSVMLEGLTYRLTADQCIIVPPLAYHSITINAIGTYRRVTALFPLDTVPEVLRGDFTATAPAVFYSDCTDRLAAAVQRGAPDLFSPLAKSLMIEVFYGMLETTRGSAAPDKDDFLEKAAHYIDQHIGRKISIDDLARHTSRSPSSFSHLFEERMGISPKQYILRKKLATARKLIAEGVPPTTAAVQVGYENYSNFYRMYRKHYGTAPAKRK